MDKLSVKEYDDLQPLLVVDQMIHDKSMRGNIGFFVDIGTCLLYTSRCV